MDSGDETESIQLINNNFNCHDNNQNNNTNNLNEEVKINIKDLKKNNNNDDDENDEMEDLYKEFQNRQHQGSIRSTGTSTDFIELIWSNLTYSIVKTSYSMRWSRLKMERKQQQIDILKNLNGKFESNKLTAIMGPSGAGKTTLMECLAGRRQLGLTGKIMVNKFGIDSKIKIAYNSQNETLLKELTVKETLLFASKICNLEQNNFDMNYFYDYNSNFQDNQLDEEFKGSKEVVQYKQLKKDGKIKSLHQLMVENLMKNLGLDQCADIRIANCSGGQLKRVSIALELITSPSILLLDEPTSGLDSVSCLSCINLLKNLSKQARPLIIAASIHQPTAKLLSYFDHLYMISYTGQCIYSGPPAKLVEHMLAFDYPCPQYHNPADFITEIANGDHGYEIINKLDQAVKDQDNKYSFKKRNNHFSGSVKLTKILRKSHVHKKKYQYTLFKTLLDRSLKVTAREPIVSYLRLVATLLILVLISFLYMDNQVGLVSGCLEFPSYETIIDQIKPQKILSPSALGILH